MTKLGLYADFWKGGANFKDFYKGGENLKKVLILKLSQNYKGVNSVSGEKLHDSEINCPAGWGGRGGEGGRAFTSPSPCIRAWWHFLNFYEKLFVLLYILYYSVWLGN